MFHKSDPITEAARMFNSAIDELITISDKIHPEEPMLKIAKRKLLWAKRVDIVLPVQLAWNNKLLKKHGKFIIDRDEQYFKNTDHKETINFGGSRNDVNVNDIEQLLKTFRNEWETKYDNNIKNNIWTATQNLYQGYLSYGFAISQC